MRAGIKPSRFRRSNEEKPPFRSAKERNREMVCLLDRDRGLNFAASLATDLIAMKSQAE
jgi:hypothetical protein